MIFCNETLQGALFSLSSISKVKRSIFLLATQLFKRKRGSELIFFFI